MFYVPAALQWELLATLRSLDTSDNQLTGSLPVTWNSLASMRTLTLSGNNFTVSMDYRCY